MAATNEQIESFIAEFSVLAINECNRRIAAGLPFVLPSVCMAQSALETGWGTAPIMVRANAYFGIKAGGSWTGKVYSAETREVYNGQSYNTVANFRAYDTKQESVEDYYRLITEASRYSKALCYGADPSKWLTPRESVTAIWQAGYATDDEYVPEVMNTLNGRNLSKYDLLITGEALTNQSFLFTASDLVQGELIATDSGRSVGIKENTAIVSVDPSKFKEADGKAVLTVKVPAGFSGKVNVRLVYILNDVAYIGAEAFKDGESVTIPDGARFGFMFVGEGTSSVTLESLSGFTLNLSNVYDFSGGGAVVPLAALAEFVKIE